MCEKAQDQIMYLWGAFCRRQQKLGPERSPVCFLVLVWQPVPAEHPESAHNEELRSNFKTVHI